MANTSIELRKKYTDLIATLLKETGEDVLRVGNAELSIPVVDIEGNDAYVNFIIKVPTGSRADKEGYDGYNEAKSYEIYAKEKEEKAAKKELLKQKKLARDAKLREEKEARKKEREKLED